MAEPNEYDLQRDERIRRNKAMLAKLQVLTLCRWQLWQVHTVYSLGIASS